MECFEKIVYGFQPLIIFEKRFILDVCQGSEYALESAYSCAIYFVHPSILNSALDKNSIEVKRQNFKKCSTPN